VVLSPATVRIKWNGGSSLIDVEMQRWQPTVPVVGLVGGSTQVPLGVPGPDYLYPISHFGSGIVTWTLPWLFRSPPGYNMLVRGPANSPKDGIAPLEGLVETDWTPATFTMNWKMTRPDNWVTFEKGEPICMIVPQRRGELEEFMPEIRSIKDQPELAAAHKAWGESRDQFNEEQRVPGTEAAKRGWQRHYFQGTAPDGSSADEHQTKRRLREFLQTGEDQDDSHELHVADND
jgi:hypothetical protein